MDIHVEVLFTMHVSGTLRDMQNQIVNVFVITISQFIQSALLRIAIFDSSKRN